MVDGNQVETGKIRGNGLKGANTKHIKTLTFKQTKKHKIHHNRPTLLQIITFLSSLEEKVGRRMGKQHPETMISYLFFILIYIMAIFGAPCTGPCATGIVHKLCENLIKSVRGGFC